MSTGTTGADVDVDDEAAPPARTGRRLVVWRGSLRWRAMVGGATGVAFVVVAVVPFLLPVLEGRLVSRFVALGVALLGLQFVVGRAGQLSLCHGVFVGVGSYTTTIALSSAGLPHLLALALAPVLGFVVGCVVGLLGLRIRAIYLGPVTLSVAVVFPMFVKRFGWFTGGSSGLPIKRGLTPPSFLGLESPQYYLWTHLVIVAIAAVAVIVVRNVVLSPIGMAVRATAENPLSAATSGIDIRRTRVIAYGFGAAVGALGGGLLVLDTPIVGADSYDLFRSLGYYAAVMVGGAVSMIGAAIGALILVGVPRLMVVYDLRTGPNLILGVLLVVSTLVTPGGISVPLRRLVDRLVEVRHPLERPGRKQDPD